MNINNYRKFLYDPISFLMERIGNPEIDVNRLHTDLVSILNYASETTIPVAEYKPFKTSYWNNDVKRAHENERSLRNLWILI